MLLNIFCLQACVLLIRPLTLFPAGMCLYAFVDDSFQSSVFIFLSFLPSGNGKLASWASILGFVVMMSLDVGLG